MKCELEGIKIPGEKYEYLGFAIRIKDLQTEKDKSLVCDMISLLYNGCCVDYRPETSEIDEMLQDYKPSARIGFVVVPHERTARLMLFKPKAH